MFQLFDQKLSCVNNPFAVEGNNDTHVCANCHRQTENFSSVCVVKTSRKKTLRHDVKWAIRLCSNSSIRSYPEMFPSGEKAWSVCVHNLLFTNRGPNNFRKGDVNQTLLPLTIIFRFRKEPEKLGGIGQSGQSGHQGRESIPNRLCKLAIFQTMLLGVNLSAFGALPWPTTVFPCIFREEGTGLLAQNQTFLRRK